MANNLHIREDALGSASTAIFWIARTTGGTLGDTLLIRLGGGHIRAPALAALKDTEGVVGTGLFTGPVGLIDAGHWFEFRFSDTFPGSTINMPISTHRPNTRTQCFRLHSKQDRPPQRAWPGGRRARPGERDAW